MSKRGEKTISVSRALVHGRLETVSTIGAKSGNQRERGGGDGEEEGKEETSPAALASSILAASSSMCTYRDGDSRIEGKERGKKGARYCAYQ